MKSSMSCKCNGTGYILTDIDGIEYAVPCECAKRRIESNRLAFANIPDMYKGSRLTGLKNFHTDPESKRIYTVACQTIKRYMDHLLEMESAGMGLFFSSATKGSGKTYLAAAVANELIEIHKKRVKFATSTSILSEIKRTYDSDSVTTESEMLNQLFLSDILIIDDFGAEKLSNWVNDRMYQIINERYVSRKITMYTSNASLSTLEYDDRIISRIKERSYNVRFPESSIRDRIFEKNNADMTEMVMQK